MDGLFALARLAAMAAMTIPAELRRLVAERERDLLGDPDLDELVAVAVMDMLQTAIDTTSLDIEQILDVAAIVEPLGGRDYVLAVLEWRDAARVWARSRRRGKGARPPAPAVPG
jgi:hypothetical protein